MVDVNHNDSLIHDFHDQCLDSRIVYIHNNNACLIVDFHNEYKDSRIIDVHNNDFLCMYMFSYVALFCIHTTIIKPLGFTKPL